MTQASAPVVEGDIVLDKYRVERVLGQGGMGVVIAATHVELDQKVALKFLLPTALEHAELVERFAREAKAAAKIQSQHVVRVLDTGRMPSGAPFMVMEYLEGEDLSAMLKRSGFLEPNVVADYLLQACEALGEAHAAGIVHRDLKPSNLFLAKQRDRRSLVKVLDFGISKLTEPDTAALTHTTVAMGSPHYMSPEQLISSKHVDPRSDIWSMGVIVYELLTGSRPFRGDTMPEIVAQVLNNEPERLSEVRADISLDLELVVARCLATDKKNRFQTVAELAAALRPFATDAAKADASVERIARVLGGVSIPPPAPVAGKSDGMVVVVDVPVPGETNRQIAPTVRPAKAGSGSAADKTPTAITAAAPPSGGSAVASEPAPKTPKTPIASLASSSAENDGENLALAATRPSNEVSAAVRSVTAPAARPPNRALTIAASGAVLCLVAFAGVQYGMTRPYTVPDVDRPRESARADAPTSASTPATSNASTPTNAATTAAAPPASSAIVAASAPITPTAPVVPPSAGATPIGRPVARSTGAAASASARPAASRDSIHMDIK